MKYPDFRAALALLKHIDQRRFGDSPAVEIHAPTITLDDARLERLRLVYETSPAALPKPGRVLELEPAKEP